MRKSAGSSTTFSRRALLFIGLLLCTTAFGVVAWRTSSAAADRNSGPNVSGNRPFIDADDLTSLDEARAILRSDYFDEMDSSSQTKYQLIAGEKKVGDKIVEFDFNSAINIPAPTKDNFASYLTGDAPDASPFVNPLVSNPAADAGANNTQSETSIVLGAGNNVVAAFNDSGSFVSGPQDRFTGYSTSSNSGSTWTDRGTLPDTGLGGGDGDDAGDPVLVRNNTTGTIIFSTLSFDTGNRLSVFRSTDNGVTFTGPINGTPGTVGGSHDKQWMAVDNFVGAGNGNVYMAWRDFGTTAGIRLTRSTDDGLTWALTGGVIAPGSPTQGAWVTVGTDHSVHVSWLGAGPSLLTRRSTDQGVTFGAPTTISPILSAGTNGDLAVGPRSSTFLQMAVNPANGHLYVVYPDNPAGADRADVFFRQSTDTGATWTAATRVNTDAGTNDNWQPTLAVTPDGGSLIVTFQDRRRTGAATNSPLEIWGRTATIAGGTVTFGCNFPISNVAFPTVFGADPVVNTAYMGDYDQTVADNTNFYTSWGDNRSGNADSRGAVIPRAGFSGAIMGFSSQSPNTPAVPNSCVPLTVTIQNDGCSPSAALTGTLTSSTPGVTITGGTQSFGTIAGGATGSNAVPFQVSIANTVACNTTIAATLTLSNGDIIPVSIPMTSTGYNFASTTGTFTGTGTLVAGSSADDAQVTIALPGGWTSSVYGTAVTSLSASTNGIVQVNGAAPTVFTNTALPGTATPTGPRLFPYWDDLLLTSAGQGIFTETTGVAPNRVLKIEWRGGLFSGGAAVNFAVLLNEGTNTFSYIYNNSATANGGSATVGVQTTNSGTAFTQFSFDSGTITSGLRLNATVGACTPGAGVCGVGPTPTPTATPTATPTSTPTATPTGTPACTPSGTPQAWAQTTPSPAPLRYRAGGTSDGTNVYVYGGGNAVGGFLNDMWRWEAATGVWTQLANMPTARQNHQGAYWAGKIYIPGGFITGSVHTNELAIYDIATNAWSTGAVQPAARTGTTAAYNGKIYSFGGNPGPSNATSIYDIATNTWSAGTNMPVGITYGRAVTVGNFIYYIGGIVANTAVSTIYRYDPAGNSWITMPTALQTARSSPEVMTDGSKIFVVMGAPGNTFFNGVPLAQTVEIYDPVANTIGYGNPVVTTASGPGGGFAGGKLMVQGGVNGTTYYDVVQVSNLGGACVTPTPTSTPTATPTSTPTATPTPPPPGGCLPTVTTFTQNTPVVIPAAGANTVTSTIVVSGAAGSITDINATTFIAHTFNSDLDVTITSPAGTIVTLTTDSGTSLDNVFNGTVWDDDANPGGPVPSTSNPGVTSDHVYANNVLASPLVPEEAMGAFIGENPNGTWTLTVADQFNLDGGAINSWSLEVSRLASAPTVTSFPTVTNSTPVVIPAAGANTVTSTIVVAGAGTAIYDLDATTFIAHTFNSDLDVTLTSPAGTIVTLTTDSAGSNDNVFNGTVWDDDADPGSPVPYANNAGVTSDRAYVNNVLASPLVPEEAMSAFYGENPNGTWTLTVADQFNLDGGTITSWSLDIDTLACAAPPANLAITKTDGLTQVNAGSPITYTIVASNAGPTTATGATVTDSFPANITGVSWTCVGAGGGTCPANGTSNINASVNLPTGGTATFTATGTVSPGSFGGPMQNTAVIIPPNTVTDPNLANNTATDTTIVISQADLQITKTDNVTVVTTPGTTTYTIVVTNNGPAPAVDARVTDIFPAGITVDNWTCLPQFEAACNLDGAGNINELVYIPVGGRLTYTAVATIASGQTGTLVNTATVTAPPTVIDPNLANNTSTDTDTYGMSISGNVQQFVQGGPNTNLAGVLITAQPGGATATTNASGNFTIAGVPGTTYTLTPTMTGKVFDPVSRTVTSTGNVTGINFIAYNSPGGIPRNIFVVNTHATPGNAVTVPIRMTAQGTEKVMRFSIDYPLEKLFSPVVTCGASTVGCTVASSNVTPGKLGISITAAGAGVAAGLREIANVTFQTNIGFAPPNAPLTFSSTPAAQVVLDAANNELQKTFTNGFVVFVDGVESDVAGRNTGNGTVASTDVVQVRRFVANLDQIDPSFNEFQRTDAAPLGTRGDGELLPGDVVQARRYAANLDAAQAAAGPAGPPLPALGTAPEPVEERPVATDREFRLTTERADPGSRVGLGVEYSPQGDEAAVSFTIEYNAARLTNPQINLGEGMPEGTVLTINENDAANGRIGVLIDSTTPLGIGSNIKRLITITFDVAANAAGGETRVLLTGSLAPKGVSDAMGNTLEAKYADGAVLISGPQATGKELSGRVTTADGRGVRGAQVTIVDATGRARTVTTGTFGYYRFDDVAADETYIIGVNSRHLQFAPKTVTTDANLTAVDFIAQE